MPSETTGTLARTAPDGAAENAVLRALAYYDLFRHPLSAEEIWERLDRADVPRDRVEAAAEHLAREGRIYRNGALFALDGDPALFERREQANAAAAAAMPETVAIARRVMRLPFVRAVAISGSLSKGVMHPDSDRDFFVITAPNRVWIVRTLLALLSRMLGDRELLCANYLVDEATLALPERDIFTAIEVGTLIPVCGGGVLRRFREANGWWQAHWPNLKAATRVEASSEDDIRVRNRRERLLPRPLADLANAIFLRGTRWHLRRKVAGVREGETHGGVRLLPGVFKVHPGSWRYRAQRRMHARLDGLTEVHGAAIDRGLDATHVLFSHSYFYRLDPKQWRFAQPYPPLGTIQAAAVARDMGFTVELLDSCLAPDEREIEARLHAGRPGTVVIYDDGFNYLTKMCLTTMRDAALRMIEAAAASGARVVVNSSDAADHYDRYLDAGAHAVIRGEGEETLRALLAAWREGAPIDAIEGLAYRLVPGAPTVLTAPRRVLRTLDSLPRPAWDLVDVEAYRKIWIDAHGRFSLNVSTTRGCPYKCNWCAKPIYGQRYNARSPEQVVDEIAWLIEWFDVRHFWMTDDIFGLKPGWVPRFADLVEQRGLKFSYTIQSRADLMLREGELEALARSGLETAWFGAESGSQKILDAMDKEISREQIDRLVPLLRAHGIRSAMFLQLGYLGEDRADIDATIDMVETLLPDQLGISVSYPLPGTPFHEKVRASLGEKRNWSDSDDLAMMFPGTYPPGFYRQLHRHIHYRHRAALARARLSGRLPHLGKRGAAREALALARRLVLGPLDTLRLTAARGRP